MAGHHATRRIEAIARTLTELQRPQESRDDAIAIGREPLMHGEAVWPDAETVLKSAGNSCTSSQSIVVSACFTPSVRHANCP